VPHESGMKLFQKTLKWQPTFHS